MPTCLRCQEAFRPRDFVREPEVIWEKGIPVGIRDGVDWAEAQELAHEAALEHVAACSEPYTTIEEADSGCGCLTIFNGPYEVFQPCWEHERD